MNVAVKISMGKLMQVRAQKISLKAPSIDFDCKVVGATLIDEGGVSECVCGAVTAGTYCGPIMGSAELLAVGSGNGVREAAAAIVE
jgi:hypothetical protein